MVLFGLGFREMILVHAAQRAGEIFGDILPLGAGGNSTLGVAQFLVVLPTANVTYIFHGMNLLFIFIGVCFLYGLILTEATLPFRDFIT